jgi:hypothetical protein
MAVWRINAFMQMPSVLTQRDYEDSLITFYFGRGPDYLSLCQKHAYRDLQRTLRGIGKQQIVGEKARKKAHAIIARSFLEIKGMSAPTEKKFDGWHRAVCEELRNAYNESGWKKFNIGHAQKWLNMTFKYVYVMGERRLPGYSHLYDFCHTPLDQRAIEALHKFGFKRLAKPWSQLSDYQEYFEVQRWVREHFKLAPLDVEFYLWMDRPLPR